MGKTSANAKVALRFNGEPHHEFVIGNITVNGGGTFSVDEAIAAELLAAPWANVTLADEKAPTWPRSHDEIDELAKKLDVELPAVPAAGGTTKPTVAEKIAALESAGFTPATALAAAESTTSEDAPAS
jgi:hypothetical protein